MIKIKNMIKHVKIQAVKYDVKGENFLFSTTFATSTWPSLSVMKYLFLTFFSRKKRRDREIQGVFFIPTSIKIAIKSSKLTGFENPFQDPILYRCALRKRRSDLICSHRRSQSTLYLRIHKFSFLGYFDPI